MDDEYYQPLGTAVLTANGFLIADNPAGLATAPDVTTYKSSLRDEGYDDLYNAILPMNVTIIPQDGYFRVEVREGDKLILVDISCTESRPDCFTYDGRCNPDTLGVWCR
jgi:hypothetical protein